MLKMKNLSWIHCLIKRRKKKNEVKKFDVKNNIAEQVMTEITSIVAKEKINLNLVNASSDGRVNSSLQEDIVTDFLRTSKDIHNILTKYNLQLNIPKDREWFDFCLFDTNMETFIPVNIKISTTKTADSVSSKKGLYYACTGVLPYNNTFDIDDTENSLKSNKWTEFYKKLKRDCDKHKDKDYYFLIVNKTDTADVFYTSLKTLKVLSPNGNNLPFLCNWGQNRERIFRTHAEARKFLLKNFYLSLELSCKSVKLGLEILKKLS